MTNTQKSGSWNDAYLFDIPVIDEQHKKLFAIYDTLSKMIFESESYDDSRIRQVLDKLEGYTRFHFQTEEDLIIKAGALNVEEHIKGHRLFIKKIEDCKLAYEYKNPLLAKNMLNFIKKWLISHILETDSEYLDEMKAYLALNSN